MFRILRLTEKRTKQIIIGLISFDFILCTLFIGYFFNKYPQLPKYALQKINYQNDIVQQYISDNDFFTQIAGEQSIRNPKEDLKGFKTLIKNFPEEYLEIEEEDTEEPQEAIQLNTNTDQEEEPPAPPPQPPPPTNGCPRVTKNCVPCNIGEAYCRALPGEEYGYLGWACQNNNPSNIRSDASNYRAGIIISMGGPAPCGDKGGYLTFSTYEDGRNGVKAYLRGIAACKHSSYVFCGCGECSIREFFTKYAPAGDQNDPHSYASYIGNKLGIDPDITNLQWVVDNKLEQMVDGIQCMEGYFIDVGGTTVKWCNI
jgi:hypothetical protein